MIKIRNKNIEKSSHNNISVVIIPYLKRWYYFLFAAIICFTIASLYIRYSIPIYKNSASVLIIQNDDKAPTNQINLIDNLEFVKSSSNLMNEIEIFKSYSVLKPIVDSLLLNINIYLIGGKSNLRHSEVYIESPIKIEQIKSSDDEIIKTKGFTFSIKINNANNYICYLSNSESINMNFGDSLLIDKNFGYFKISKTENFNKKKSNLTYEIEIKSKEAAIQQLRNSLKIEKLNKDSDVISISIDGYNSDKNNKILNALIESYKRDALNDKNLVKSNTSDFIKGRIHFLLEELNEVERNGEKYKTSNGITDFDSDIDSYISGKSLYEKNLISSNIQLSLMNLLIEHLNKVTRNDELLPANLGFEDITINNLTDQYNKLVLERNKNLQNAKTSNPVIEKIDMQLNSIKQSLSKSLQNQKTIYEVQLKKYNSEFNDFKGELSQIPKLEREYKSIIRQQQIKESLYLYLLQKREENEIELAASVSDLKIIIPPINNGVIVSPKNGTIYLFSFFFSFIIPFIIIYLVTFFDDKVGDEKDLVGYTILGEIPKINTRVERKLLAFTDRNLVTESFRMLRTNLNFSLLNENQSKVIAISSILPNEGKTFISLNLANFLSSTGKKVVVVGTDLRIPDFHSYFPELKSATGLSNFIVNSEISVDSIIYKSSTIDNLFIIPSGDIPPNPAEILLTKRFSDVVHYLKQNFDFIVLDTSPIGIVSDCLPIIKTESDLLLLVVRVGYLKKKFLKLIDDFTLDKNIKKMSIVMNYSNLDNKVYGYGFGKNGYYVNDDRNSYKTNLIINLVRKLIKRIRLRRS